MVIKYVRQTHAKTHSQYRMEVTDVFAMERSGEKEAFNDVGKMTMSKSPQWKGTFRLVFNEMEFAEISERLAASNDTE